MSNYSYWMFLGFINLTGGHRLVQDFGMKVWTWFHDRDWSLMNSEATGLPEKHRIQEPLLLHVQKIGELSIKHGSTFPFSTRMKKSLGVEWHSAGEHKHKLDTSGVSCNSSKHRWCYQKAPRSLASSPRYLLWYLLPTCGYVWKWGIFPMK